MPKAVAKTALEIKKEIERLRILRRYVPKRNAFGEDNWGQIDLMIEILERGFDEDGVDRELETLVEEESLSEDRRDELASDGYAVVDWRKGERSEAPSSGWENFMPTAKKKTAAKKKPKR